MGLLDEEQIAAALSELDGWTRHENRPAIERHFQFADFNGAFGFMTQVALHAERLNHHPEWFNVWNRVEVVLSTHDAGGITEKDVALARLMSQLAS